MSMWVRNIYAVEAGDPTWHIYDASATEGQDEGYPTMCGLQVDLPEVENAPLGWEPPPDADACERCLTVRLQRQTDNIP